MPDPSPSPPPIPPSEPPADLPPGETSVGLAPNVAAGIACIFPLVGGIAFLILEKRSAFVRFYAMQSIFLGALSLIAQIVFSVTGAVLFHIPVLGGVFHILLGLVEFAFWVAWLVAYIVQIVKAFSGTEWEIPFLGPLVRQQLAKVNI